MSGLKSYKSINESAPMAKDVYDEMKAAEPYKTIMSDSDQKQYITKVKKILKKYGVASWKVDDAVKEFTKQVTGREKIFISTRALVQQMIKSKDLSI